MWRRRTRFATMVALILIGWLLLTRGGDIADFLITGICGVLVLLLMQADIRSDYAERQ